MVVALVWTALTLAPLFDGSDRDRLGPALVLGVCAGCVLVLRCRWPVPVLLVLLVLALVSHLAGLDVSLGLMVMVASYTVVVDQGTRSGAAIITALLLVLAAVRTGAWAGGDQLDEFLLAAAVVVAVVGFALYRAARLAGVDQLRERNTLLQQRAELQERDQEQQRRLAVDDERMRIAAGMHDVVGHHLTVMVTLAEGTLRVLPAGDPATEPVRLIADTGRDALVETRRLLGLLRTDPGPPTVSTDERVRALAESVAVAGVAVTLTGSARWDDLPPELADDLIQVTREALTNVLKHAGPGSAAVVALERDGSGVRLTVTDDGAGTPTAPAVSSHAGVVGIVRRLAPWSGRVDAGPRPGGGWSLDISCRSTPRPAA